MENYGTTLAEAFAQKVMQLFFSESVTERITNKDYEGEIKDKATILSIITFEKLGLHDYTGTPLANPDVPQESVGQLNTNQRKMYYFQVESLAKLQSWIKDPQGSLLPQSEKTLKETIDTYNLSFYTKVAAGQRLGTVYNTGTVAVAATTGVVTGTGTAFTAAMVGRGFKAAGMTKWYRVSAYTSVTQITIVDDLDDTGANAYTGGLINAGATYTIEAVTPVQLSASNIYQYIVNLRTLLNQAKVPASDRWLVLPSQISAYLLQANVMTPSVPQAYEDVVKSGRIGKVAGFDVFESELVNGDGVNGYHCLAGHKSAITHALAYTETGIEPVIGGFGVNYKGVTIYGSKVVDARRSALAELFAI